MGSRVGPLQAPRISRSIWPAALIAALLAVTISVVAVSMGSDETAPSVGTTTEVVTGTAVTSGGSTLANTPTALRYLVAGGRGYRSLGR